MTTNTVTNEIIESKIAGVMYMNGADMVKVNGINNPMAIVDVRPGRAPTTMPENTDPTRSANWSG